MGRNQHISKAHNFLLTMEADGWRYLLDAERVNKEIPAESGIYCFIRYDVLMNDLSEVVYVGKSVNLSIRLKPWHPVENKFDNRFGSLFCYIKPCQNQDILEREYIIKFAPMFNIQHNPKITRKIIYQYGKKVYR